MYTGFLLFILLGCFCANAFLFVIRSNWRLNATQTLTNVLLVVYLTMCTLFAVFFLGSEFGGYFSVLSDDSLRYTKEAIMFSSSPWLVDELSGEYLNYKVTPKMGISSLLAWLSLPFDVNMPITFYVINNLSVLMFFFVVVSLLHSIFIQLPIKTIYFYLATLLLLVVPMDFYWLFKMLRESSANCLLLILLLLPILMFLKPKRRYIFMYTYFSFWLLLYRPQLAILSGSFFFVSNFLISKKITYSILAVATISFSLFQSIATTGIQRLHGVFSNIGLSFVGSILEYILQTERDVFLILLLCVTIVLSVFVKKGDFVDKRKIFKTFRFVGACFILLGIAVFLTQSFMQIRFIYPFLFFAKISLMCHMILKLSANKQVAHPT